MKTSTLFLIAFIVMTIISCQKKPFLPIAGKGNSSTKVLDHSGFDRLDLSIDATVDYTQDSVYRVEIDAQSNIQNALKINVDGTVLHITSNRPLWHHKPIRIKVHSPNLNGLSVSGSGGINAQTPIKTSSLDIDISGSGSVTLASLTTQTIKADLSGSGKLNVWGGTALNENLDVSGSGDIDALNLQADESTANLSGSGSLKVNVLKKLDVNISGSGDVKYSGIPNIYSKVSGSGKLINLN